MFVFFLFRCCRTLFFAVRLWVFRCKKTKNKNKWRFGPDLSTLWHQKKTNDGTHSRVIADGCEIFKLIFLFFLLVSHGLFPRCLWRLIAVLVDLARAPSFFSKVFVTRSRSFVFHFNNQRIKVRSNEGIHLQKKKRSIGPIRNVKSCPSCRRFFAKYC